MPRKQGVEGDSGQVASLGASAEPAAPAHDHLPEKACKGGEVAGDAEVGVVALIRFRGHLYATPKPV